MVKFHFLLEFMISVHSSFKYHYSSSLSAITDNLVLKIHKILFCQNYISWPIFDKVLMLPKQREIANLDLYFLTYIIIEDFTLFQNLDSTYYAYFADQIEKLIYFQFLTIISSLKHICLMEHFTNWSVKLTLFFRTNIFSTGIASLLIFSLILKDFIAYQTMYFIVSSFTLTIVEGRFHEANTIILIYSVIWKQRSTFLINLLLMKLLRLYKYVCFNFIRPMLPDDYVNMKFLIGKLEPYCVFHFIYIVSFFNTCICSGFILTTLDLLFNCLLA